MAETMNISPEKLQSILEAVLKANNQLNPLEQRKYDEEMNKQRRRDALAQTVGHAEELAQRARRNSCSHMRFGPSAGKLAGQLAPKGASNAEYCTGGQAYQNGLAMLFCSRCQSSWWFQPTQEYYTYILQNGMEGSAPPPEEDSICIGCYEPKPRCKCTEMAKEYVAAHPTVS